MTKFIALESIYNGLKADSAPKSELSKHINILKIEDLVTNGSANQTSYSKRDFFKISLVAGHCIIHYADRSITVKKYALVFTNPFVPYKWEIISKKQEGHVCVFTDDFLTNSVKIHEFPAFSSGDKAVILLDQNQFDYFAALFLRIKEELGTAYQYKNDYLQILLLQIIHEGQKLNPEQGEAIKSSNAAERIYLLFNDLLERQFLIANIDDSVELRTPSDFATKLSVHINHLNKALKAHTGQTTSALIANKLIQEAKILLKTSNWTVAEISRCFGFTEPNNFSSYFKAYTQVSPAEFRKIMD